MFPPHSTICMYKIACNSRLRYLVTVATLKCLISTEDFSNDMLQFVTGKLSDFSVCLFGSYLRINFSS